MVINIKNKYYSYPAQVPILFVSFPQSELAVSCNNRCSLFSNSDAQTLKRLNEVARDVGYGLREENMGGMGMCGRGVL
jgi:hypothetical protein